MVGCQAPRRLFFRPLEPSAFRSGFGDAHQRLQVHCSQGIRCGEGSGGDAQHHGVGEAPVHTEYSIRGRKPRAIARAWRVDRTSHVWDTGRRSPVQGFTCVGAQRAVQAHSRCVHLGLKPTTTSGGTRVSMMQAADLPDGNHLALGWTLGSAWHRRVTFQREMRA